MAVVAEPVPGATSGAVPAVPGYYRRTREICDRHGGLPILDKGICGMGRTGTLSACDQEGISPDIAKGLGAGSQPVGAMLRTARLQNANEASSGPFLHGHTHMGHPTAAALAVLPRLTGDGPVARARIMGERLEAALRSTLGEPPMSATSSTAACFAASSGPKTTPAAPIPARAQGPCPDRGRRFRGRAALPSDGRHH
ncbi:aminotransferase class III-fold pyridoxal phosphate-dependent enzyme [Rhodovulum sulfidophilum]|uniref:aminotransferase class III-fold pyridoxal phosphate-dependent enzyme n=1 Tax=Rhodovulum sulfidophilum TaxID=35806 RepID=UPI001EEE9B69|nr:aminotransferase class III-fold pyridoxal phosphate-dependent enzyme [Rhodovulum sulfidophilum]